MESRIQSIDVFRALTMLLMIWVNDFWTLSEVPTWLEHMPADADALGFSDVIFPAFLVIVGLSIPFALRSRLRAGHGKARIAVHIVKRSLSLLVMGVLMVNLENYGDASALLPRWLWQLLMVLSFFLIWNDYPSHPAWKRRAGALQGAGWLILCGIAILYRSSAESGYAWLEPRWWGILGLIGWSYLICSLACLAVENRPRSTFAFWLAFSLFNVASFAGWLEFLYPVRNYVWIVGEGSMPALTLAGCVVSTLYLSPSGKLTSTKFLLVLGAFGASCIVVGLSLRPFWGISKIGATPSWTQICAGLSLLAFAALYWIADVKKATRWAAFLKPAGIATLTCYLVPYLVYPIQDLIGWRLPEALRSGIAGLASSMLFALLVVFATGILTRFSVKLKL